MNYPPYQMNQTKAAEYCCVSVTYFREHYRPHIPFIVEGGNVYFLRHDIEEFLCNKFKENGRSKAIVTNRIIHTSKSRIPSKPKDISESGNAFLEAVERLNARKKSEGR